MESLTPEERNFFLKYAQRPDNLRIALSIGEIHQELRSSVRSSFLEEMNRQTTAQLSEKSIPWTARIAGEKLGKGSDVEIYVLRRRESSTEIQLRLERDAHLYWAVPASGAEDLAVADLVQAFDRPRQGQGYQEWKWWSYADEQHRDFGSLTALLKLNEDKDRQEKIRYFVAFSVHAAESIEQRLRGRE